MSASSGLDSFFFGHSLVPSSVMRKTKEYREIDASYYLQIAESLKSDPILLAVFDNTQIGVPLKYERDGKSSLFLKLTAKMFVKLQYSWSGHDLKKTLSRFLFQLPFWTR